MTKAERLVWAAGFVAGGPRSAAEEVSRLRWFANDERLEVEVGKEAADLLREFVEDQKPGPAACPACGALARKDGKCMGCDRVLQDA